MQRIALLFTSLLLFVHSDAQQLVFNEQADRWTIEADGSILWTIDNRLPHSDHIEMSGQKISMWIQYEIDSLRRPAFNRTMVFPTFRMLPVRTIAHMMYDVKDAELPRILINDKLYHAGVYNASVQSDYPEKVISIRHKGIMEVWSELGKEGALQLHRSFFPSTDRPLAIEKMVFVNTGNQPVKVELEYMRRESKIAMERSSGSQHSFLVSTINDGLKTINPGDSVVFGISYQALDRPSDSITADIKQEETNRRNRIKDIQQLLVLETPDPVLNTMFAFAKIRATESIYNTKGGLMHGPGGLRYYAAIWANDQAEYVNPFFAFLGDTIATRSAMNAYRLFARYINPDYKPIPSSIIAEGDGVWQGAKDRGDMAMIAYGASRYALTYGNRDSANVLWPLIEWSLEYLHRKLNASGVVTSNSDELEGRFPAGTANLNTSSLYYDALKSAVYLGSLLGKPVEQLHQYGQRMSAMRTSIENYFGATVEGFKTYRYYAGNDTLRAWITTPLTVDIFDRKEGTIAALFSPRLWTADGLASLAGNKTFWDRSTLYGLRGAFAAGETEQALRFLKYYSQRRLLGEHVPYAVEAYPEGNQRHLSAESGLYCRIYTEGLFGMRPVGFHSFDLTPHLPHEWNTMALRNIHSFGSVFDLEIARVSRQRLKVMLIQGSNKKTYLIKEGSTSRIDL